MAIDGPDDQEWWNSQQPSGNNPPPGPWQGMQGDGGGGGWDADYSSNPVSKEGGGGFMDLIKGMFPGGQDGGFGFGGLNANMIPFIATALNQYNNSGKYMDLATKYADEMNPFGKQRGYYQDRLRSMTEDPNAYLESSPDYQAALRQGLGAVDRSAASKGYAGSGTGTADVMRFGSDLGAKYLDRDRQSLMQMAGANIGPNAAAGLISEGMRGSIDSQNQALANLFGAFTKPKEGGGVTINNNNGGPGGGGGNVPDWLKNNAGGPAGYAGMMQQLIKAGMSPQQAQELIRYSGGGVDQGPDIGQNPAHPGGGLVDTGDGWYDPEMGRYYDYDGNIIGNVGGPGEVGDWGGGDWVSPEGNENYNWLFGD